MNKKVEKISDMMVYILAILLVVAKATKWNVVVRAFVIVDALVLLVTVLYKFFVRK